MGLPSVYTWSQRSSSESDTILSYLTSSEWQDMYVTFAGSLDQQHIIRRNSVIHILHSNGTAMVSILKSIICVLQLFPWCFYQTRTKKSNVSEPRVLFCAKWFFIENSEPKSNIQLHKICLSVAQLGTVVHYSAFQNRAMCRFENHRETP